MAECNCGAVVFMLLAVLSSISYGKEELVKFDAKPFGQLLTESVELGNTKCTFSYKSVGGTNENWELKLVRKKKSVQCIVERPSASSYLYFMMFSLTLEGADVQSAEAFSNARTPLPEKEYTLQGNTVSNSDGFSSNLVAVVLKAKRRLKKSKEDL